MASICVGIEAAGLAEDLAQRDVLDHRFAGSPRASRDIVTLRACGTIAGSTG